MVRCACCDCGCHLLGALTPCGVRGQCGNCLSYRIRLVRSADARAPLPAIGLLAETRRRPG